MTLQARPVLDALDGRITLQQIQADLGQEALDLVGSLYLRGLVTLEK